MENSKRSAKYIIIGAGLSGLTTAQALLDKGETDLIILEGRDRLGGRIHTDNAIDLGATWFQDHHSNLNRLLDTHKLSKFEQFNQGQSVLVYNTMAPAHYFESPQGAPSAYRISGGSIALINELAATLKNKIKIKTKTKLLQLKETAGGITLHTSDGIYDAESVVVTIPPKLATTLDYEPALPEALISTMKRTHTWMSNAVKVGLLFSEPFWRTNNRSGTLIGQVGPVIELYDHCDVGNRVFGLMGFVNEGLRDVSETDRKERILSYLQKYLGDGIRQHTAYLEKDWSKDRFTACENLKSVYMSPQYGDPLFESFHMNGKLLFSGTETSPMYGGYLDGAVYSGQRAAKLLLDQVLT